MAKQTPKGADSNAYGTFLFRDGGYLPGILLTAHKLRELGDKSHKLICCYTSDVEQYIIDIIASVYDEVYPVEYLKFGKNRSGRQAPLPYMFTRFRMLQMTQPLLKYKIDKILVFDADMLPLVSYDDLFKLNAPAAIINEAKDRIKGDIDTDQKVDKWEWHYNYEPECAHGKLMPKEITDRPLELPETNMGVNGGLMMLKPSDEDFQNFSQWCEQHEETIDRMPWPDMQAVTAYYSGEWTSIDAKYLGLYGYPNVDSLNGIHFIGPKPWQWRAKGFAYRLNNFPDYKVWATEYLKMCDQRPGLLKHKQLSNLKREIESALI